MPKIINHKTICKKAQTLRKSGHTFKQISQSLNISYPTLKKVFHDQSHKRQSQKLKDKIYKYHEKGLSYAEISRITNCSRQYAHKIINNV